jgi:GDP-mannose transporter
MTESKPLLPHSHGEGGPGEALKPRGSRLKWLFGASLVPLIIAYYAACSSTLLVINKVAVHSLPAPAFVLTCQLVFAAVLTRGLGLAGVMHVEPLEKGKVIRFMGVVAGFLGTLFSNMKVLQNANVETFITFRSSTPLILSVLDWLLLGRELPSLWSWMMLLGMLCGSVGYVLHDSAFRVAAYAWLFVWYCFFIFDCVYMKHTCDNVPMSNWGRVYYTNVLAAVPLTFMVFVLDEVKVLATISWAQAAPPLMLSALVGMGMSHASYLLRESVSATMFTVVGIMCKLGSVAINYVIWENHANPAGISFLLLCLLCGSLYRQPPKRSEATNL